VLSKECFHHLPIEVNICDYLEAGQYPTHMLLFCPENYPSPKNNKTQPNVLIAWQGWLDLKRDLQIAAHVSGNPIICNGDNGSPCRLFKCTEYRDRVSQAQPITASNNYRNTTLMNNDEANRLNTGKSGPRRMQTTDKSRTYRRNFTVKWDEFAFYVELERRCGNPTHEHHPRLYHPASAPVPICLLTEQQRENTKNVIDATSDKASGRNFLLRTMGINFDTIKLTYLDCKMKGHDKSGDDIDCMIKNFELSNKIKFTTLSDVPMSAIKGIDTTNTNMTLYLFQRPSVIMGKSPMTPSKMILSCLLSVKTPKPLDYPKYLQRSTILLFQ